MYKRKAVESAQTAADLKLHLDKYHAQLKEAQIAVAEKTGTTQQQGFKFKRIQVRTYCVDIFKLSCKSCLIISCYCNLWSKFK